MRSSIAWMVAAFVLVAGACAAQDKPAAGPKLSELQVAKAQNLGLRVQNLQLQKASVEQQLKSAEADLTAVRVSLETEFTATMKCSTSWDWATMACATPAETPAPKK